MRKRLRTTFHAATTCPFCGKAVDAATSLEGDWAPTPGCVSICLECAGVSEFTEGMELEPFKGELDPASAQLVRRARAAIAARKPS